MFELLAVSAILIGFFLIVAFFFGGYVMYKGKLYNSDQLSDMRWWLVEHDFPVDRHTPTNVVLDMYVNLKTA